MGSTFFPFAPEVLSELVRFQDRAKEQNTMKFAKLKRGLEDERKSEILNVQWVWRNINWDLQRQDVHLCIVPAWPVQKSGLHR